MSADPATAAVVQSDPGGDGWREADWESLLLNIKFGGCTPFVARAVGR
jgi:hypothetical protein